MLDLRLTSAVLFGKVVDFSIKRLGSTGATSAPGYYALKIDPLLVKKISRRVDRSILVTGTNGKTTTARLISALFNEEKALHNREGSNLLRGIASVLVKNLGILRHKNISTAIWETDEAAIGDILNQVEPDIVIVTNLFRDQLDRYGEVNALYKKIRLALTDTPKKPILVLNANDPNVASLGHGYREKVIYFGLDKYSNPTAGGVPDAVFCPICGNKLKYLQIFYSHIGNYSCLKCSFKTPQIDVLINDSADLSLRTGGKDFKVKTNLEGLYNHYNIASALGVWMASGYQLEDEEIKKIEGVKAVFGRQEEFVLKNGRKVKIILVKNPTAFNQVLATIGTGDLAIILNDNYADGRDVSWIWDIQIDNSKYKDRKFFVAGSRSWDMANRLKYAGISMDKIVVQKSIQELLKSAESDKSNIESTLYILPTYTALLQLKRRLSKGKYTSKFWHG